MKEKLARLAALGKRNDVKAGLAIGAAAIAGAANAAIDVTEAVTKITEVTTAITTLGMAVLSVVVTVKLFTWVRGALK